MAENSMRDAILSVVEAKGGSAEGVGPLDRDALDRLLDTMAGSDQPVTSGMSDAQVVRALAQYAHGGGGGSTVTLDIVEFFDNAPLSTAYFTAEDSSGTQLTITPVTESDSKGGFHYFTVTANAGELLTFRTVEGSEYEFASDTKYVMYEQATFPQQVTFPLDFDARKIQFVLANVPSAVAPHPYLTIALFGVQ